MPVYNKLIRDRIPEIIENDGKTFNVRKLSEVEYEIELLKKISEEVIEFQEAETVPKMKEELADLMEIIHAIFGRLTLDGCLRP